MTEYPDRIIITITLDDDFIYVAKCNGLGLVATHKNKEQALIDLLDCMRTQLNYAIDNDNVEYLWLKKGK
jgi:hypothetical protein